MEGGGGREDGRGEGGYRRWEGENNLWQYGREIVKVLEGVLLVTIYRDHF